MGLAPRVVFDVPSTSPQVEPSGRTFGGTHFFMRSCFAWDSNLRPICSDISEVSLANNSYQNLQSFLPKPQLLVE